MRKLISCFAVLAVCAGARADVNPFFNGAENQIAFNFGWGVNSGFIVPPPTQWVPFNMFHLQYSQPTTFFRLPARQSVNIVQTLGHGGKYGWQWDKYTIPIALLSEDVVLYNTTNWYYFTGLAVGMQAQQNKRIGSKLIFGFKLGAGYHITDNWAVEAFMQHYSNGNTAEENNSYAFYGMGVAYNF